MRIDYASSSASSASSAIDAIGNRSATSTSSGGFGWTLPDLHGNVAGILGSSGSALSDAFRYDAYGRTIGKTISSLPTPWRFQGRMQLSTDDGSGNSADLYDFAARAYDPSLGVFTSFDSVTGGAQNPITLNRFLYAAANPATLIDPDGHFFTGMSVDASDSGLGNVGARYVATEVKNRTAHRNYVRRQRITQAGAQAHRDQFLVDEGLRTPIHIAAPVHDVAHAGPKREGANEASLMRRVASPAAEPIVDSVLPDYITVSGTVFEIPIFGPIALGQTVNYTYTRTGHVYSTFGGGVGILGGSGDIRGGWITGPHTRSDVDRFVAGPSVSGSLLVPAWPVPFAIGAGPSFAGTWGQIGSATPSSFAGEIGPGAGTVGGGITVTNSVELGTQGLNW